jgi:cytochrome P450
MTDEASLPPGPRIPPSAQVLNIMLRPAQFLEECRRQHGDLFTLRLEILGKTPNVLISDPELTATLFRDATLTQAGGTRGSMAPIFGENSVLLLDGAEHMRRRRSLRPAFHGSLLDRYRDGIVTATDREIDRWKTGRAFSLRPGLRRITLDSILDSVFGFRDAERQAEFGYLIDRLLAIAAHPAAYLGRAIPAPLRAVAARTVTRHRRALDAAILEEIALRRADPSTAHRIDAVSHLIVLSEGERGATADASLCDQVRTLLLAGHESTATSLAWTLEHLLHQSTAHERLGVEVTRGKTGDPYVDAVCTEALRMSPPLLYMQRQLTVPLQVGGHLLSASTLVAPCAYLVHRRPDLYPEPNAFRPERFLGNSPDPIGWLPFGGGSRRCLGAQFARFQMNTILRRLFERTELRAASPRECRRGHLQGIVFTPAHGARAVMTKRVAASA